MNAREKEIVAHHESGHALLAEILPTTDRVHKVSMIPRGLGALGYTMQLPLEDRYLMTRPELLDKITVLMGGRAAERVVFNEVSTGATDDLQRATDLARRMVSQFGMSSVLGAAVGRASRRRRVEARFLPGAAAARRARLLGAHAAAHRSGSERSCCGARSTARWRCSSTIARSCWRWRRGCARRKSSKARSCAWRSKGAEAPPSLQGPDEQQWAQLPH